MQAVRPENYRPRAIDRRIDQLLRSFGAVEIAGPKWCGKTWTLLAHAGSADLLTDPSTLLAAQSSPDLVLSGERPHLIDEWQEVPQIWDMVRSRIDSSAGERGQFILTGSSAPHDIETIRHSGAGRIARVHMRPMTSYEAGATPGGVSLRGLLTARGSLRNDAKALSKALRVGVAEEDGRRFLISMTKMRWKLRHSTCATSLR